MKVFLSFKCDILSLIEQGYFTFEEFVKFLQKQRDTFNKKKQGTNYFREEIKNQKNKQRLIDNLNEHNL